MSVAPPRPPLPPEILKMIDGMRAIREEVSDDHALLLRLDIDNALTNSEMVARQIRADDQKTKEIVIDAIEDLIQRKLSEAYQLHGDTVALLLLGHFRER